MARMSIDDKLTRDPRAVRLGRIYGWRRQEAIGRLLDVFALTYDRERDVIPGEDIDIAAEQDGFAVSMELVGLAEKTPKGYRVKGAAERIRYLQECRDSGRVGGIKSGESRRERSKGNAKRPFKGNRSDPSEGSEGLGKPPPPPPPPPPVQERESASGASGSAVPDPPKRKRTDRGVQIPEGWRPSTSSANQSTEADARKRGVNLVTELESLHDWARSHGITRKDWDAQWRNWMRRARPSLASETRNGTSKQTPLRIVAESDEPDLSVYDAIPRSAK